MEAQVYLIGCGMHKKHLTAEARQAISKAGVLLYDRLIDESILESNNAEKIYVGKKPGQSKKQEGINELMHSLASEGKTVARLKSGNPLLFSRGFEEYEYLTGRGINVKIIPGLSTFSILSELGIPLTHRTHSSSVAFITGTKKDGTVGDADADTLIYYMPVLNLEKIIAALLKKRDRETRCLIAENAFMDNYRLIDGRLKDITQIAEEAEITSPAILVVGDVLKMRKPRLKNRRILSFRQEDRGEETIEFFRGLGANPVNYPLFTIKYLEFPLPNSKVYAFTSVNSVRSVFDKYKPDGEFVAVGSRTKEELDRYGVKSQTPDMETVKGMETYLKKKYSKEDVTIFSSKKSNAREFTNIAVYDTIPIKHNNLDKTLESADVIFLSSPLITRRLMEGHPTILYDKTIMAIGPRTAAEAKRFNLHVDFMLEKPALGQLSTEDVI